MESNEADSPSAAPPSAPCRLSPPIIVDSTPVNAAETTVHVPRKAAAAASSNSRPPLASASQSSSMSSKGEQGKSGMRRLEKQAEVEETDALLHEQHQQLSATSPTTAGGCFPEIPRTVASLDVPGRAASFDSSSLTSNGGGSMMPTPQNSIEKQNSLERPARLGYSENSSPASMSRDSSTECNPYTDYTGADLEAFIRGHLNKSAKDREVLMSIEQRLSDFVKQGKTQCYSFPQMSSYHRMFVHRVSAYFGLDHNVDQTGKAVIVSLTPNTRVPDFKFRDLCSDLPPPSNNSVETRKLILKRDSSDDASRQANLALENTLAFSGLVHGGTPASSGAGSPRAASVDGSLFPNSELPYNNNTRSFEEREADYQKVRRRIFNEGIQLELQHQQQTNCLGSPSSHPQYTTGVTWSSTDNSMGGQVLSQQSTGQTISGPFIAKANSFGGTSVPSGSVHRTLPINVSQSNATMAAQLSASPSGLGTLIVPQQQQQQTQRSQQQQQQQQGLLGVPAGAVYVLAPSVDFVSAGSVIISPQTGEAFLKRPDGTLQPVVLGAVNSNAGSPVQAAPPTAPTVYVQQSQGSAIGVSQQGQPAVLSRFLVASMPGESSSTGQPTYAIQQPSQLIVGPGQPQSQQPQDVSMASNLHEALGRMSLIPTTDLTQYAGQMPSGTYIQQQQPPPQQQQQQQQQSAGPAIAVSHPSAGPPVILASMPVASGGQQPSGSTISFPQPISSTQTQNGSYPVSFQISNGHYIYQIAPASSLLSGPPPSNQSPQSPEVGSPQAAQIPLPSDGSTNSMPSQSCWIVPLAQTNTTGANDPSVSSNAPRQVILIPSYTQYCQQTPGPPTQQQQQPQQAGQASQVIDPAHYAARGQQPTILGPQRNVYGPPSYVGAQVVLEQQQQQPQQAPQQQAQQPQQPPSHMGGRVPNFGNPPPVPPRQVHHQQHVARPQQFMQAASSNNNTGNALGNEQ